MSEKIFASGIDGRTGLYSLAPLTDLDLAARVADRGPLSAEDLRELIWWTEGYGVEDPQRAPVEDADPMDLASAGWGVLFASDVGREVRRALEPLLFRRRELAGPRFKVFEYLPGQSREDFLAAHKAPPGPSDPEAVPYYLLIVGDPRAVPFEFQCRLDIQYAVGRIWFPAADEYARYAESVIRAETSPPARPNRLTLFGVANEDDGATQSCLQDLIIPLGEGLAEELKGKGKVVPADWEVTTILGAEATKERLARVLGGNETSPLLVTASHGMSFPCGDPGQLDGQGAILCQDWPGPGRWEGEIPPGFYFSAKDLGDEADVHGTIIFQLACFGGGTPELDGFAEDPQYPPARIAPHPFVARLPQRLLSHPRGGALAVVAHVDRAWTTTFNWSRRGQTQLFNGTIKRLLKGHPVGSAMEHFNQRHAELAVKVSGLWADIEASLEVRRSRFSRVWRAENDARNFLVFGDPAVRLTEP